MLPTPTCFSHHRINAFLPCYQPKILHNPSSTQICYQFKPVTKATMSFIPLCLQSHCAIFTTRLPTSHCVTHSISICYQQHHVTSSPQYCSTHHVTHSDMLLNLHDTHTMMSPTSTWWTWCIHFSDQVGKIILIESTTYIWSTSSGSLNLFHLIRLTCLDQHALLQLVVLN